MTSKDPLGDALGLNAIERKRQQPIDLVPRDPSEVTDPDSDLGVARDNLHDIITKTKGVLDELGEIAKTSENAKDFTAYAQVMKAFLEANRDLVDVSTRRKTGDLPGGVDTSTTKGGNVTNNLVVTTAQLDEVLAKLKNG